MVLFPLLFSGAIVATVWQTPEMRHLPLFLGMAVFGTLGMTLITQGFRLAPAAVVAPFDYTALIWASLLGWLVWGEIPGVWTYAGAAVRSEEHTSELQSLMRNSYAVFCLKKKKHKNTY